MILDSYDPVRTYLNGVLERMQAGDSIDHRVARQCLDLTEEAGRRDEKGQIQPGKSRNEAAARHLARKAACMANSPGGGALLVGVADDGTIVTTALDEEWLRRRIYELTERRLTADVCVVYIHAQRLIAVISPPVMEPIRWEGKIHWRVGASCVEIDASTWHSERLIRRGYDESSQPSQYTIQDVSAVAMAYVRDSLQESGDEESLSLLQGSDSQLLRRLGAVTGDDVLTQAAALLFVGRDEPMIQYIYREYSGGDSVSKVQRSGRSLAESLQEVLVHLGARNPISHLHGAASIGQRRAIPQLAAREAIVNALAHRDWHSPQPTLVEHVGTTLKVTSPGGFVGGVNESNILTHPSVSRNRALTQLLAKVKLAEQEGIGVDRMVASMVCAGLRRPEIVELTGPMVRATLLGGSVDQPWVRWLSLLTPEHSGRDLNVLLLLRQILEQGWVDAARAVPILQIGKLEAQGELEALEQVQCGGGPVVQRVDGVPSKDPPAWCFNASAKEKLQRLDDQQERSRPTLSRKDLAQNYARFRGRISSTELASLTNIGPSNAGRTLRALADEGLLEGSNPSGRGQGFHYRWIGSLA